MSFLNINSLLTTISTYPVNSSTGVGVPFVNSPSDQLQDVDRFTRGQAWKNRAVSPGVTGEKGPGNVYSRSDVAPAVRPLQRDDGNRVSPEDSPAQQVSEETSSEESPLAEKTEEAVTLTKPTGEPLSQSEQALLETLRKADLAVRAHERAHLTAAGGLAKGGASFKMQKGPDGKSYAVGGEVQIDMSQAATPEMTMQKMRIVRRAALAPVDPSPQDQKVAAQATINIAEASQELNLEKMGSSGEAGKAQKGQTVDGQDRSSAGTIYQKYGQNLAFGVGEQNSAPGSVKQHTIASYGEVAPVSRSHSAESTLSIIA